MRFARWRAEGRVHDGVVVGTDGVDLLLAFDDGTTVRDLARAGLPAALERGQAAIDAAAASGGPGVAPSPADVELLPPIEPASVRDFVAFEEHVEGVVKSVAGGADVDAEWYDAPTFYFTNPHTLVGSGATVRPPATERLDFELEVAVVIGAVEGREGRDLDPAEASDHVFGYAIFNDWSARDLQAREMKVRLGPCKGKDFASTLGPWIVTADEFAGRHDDEGFLPIGMEVLVNGERIGVDLLSNMGWPFAELIAYASRDSVVVPGDVLGSGTAGNGGCLGELWGRRGEVSPRPLREGDEVVMRVEGIGEIRNVIGASVDVPRIPAARPRPRNRPASV